MTDLHKFICLLLCLATMGASTMLEAQPDLSGYWMISFGPIPPQREATSEEQAMINALPPGTLLLADSGLREFPEGDYGGLNITESARLKAASYDPSVQVELGSTCQPPSIIYSMQGPFPMEIYQGRDLVVIKMEYFDVVRIIHMNMDAHPDNLPPTVSGHSIGHWDGDTLIVDTINIKESTFLNNGLDHTQDMHLVEHFRLGEDGEKLFIMQEYEDPAVFASRSARLIPLNKGGEDDVVWPYDCDPSYGAAIETREQN
jgi:hypothetical protein